METESCNPKKLIARVKQIEGKQLLALGPGPIRLHVGDGDARGARLLELAIDICGGENFATGKDVEDCILNALWWFQFSMTIEQGVD